MNRVARRTLRLAISCAAALATLWLSGCGNRTPLSGTYVAHNANSAEILQLVEAPDHRLSGTLQASLLNADGLVDTSSWSVTGSANGKDITLWLQKSPSSAQQQYAATRSGNSLTLSGAIAQPPLNATAVQFERSALSNYNLYLAQLDEAAHALLLQRQRAEHPPAFQGDAAAFAAQLRGFVAQAHDVIGRTPLILKVFEDHLRQQQAALERIRALESSGEPAKIEQATAMLTRLRAAEADFRRNHPDTGVVVVNEAKMEAADNALIDQFAASCANWPSVAASSGGAPASDARSTAENCQNLREAMQAYRQVLPPLHAAIDKLSPVSADAGHRLAGLGQGAN